MIKINKWIHGFQDVNDKYDDLGLDDGLENKPSIICGFTYENIDKPEYNIDNAFTPAFIEYFVKNMALVIMHTTLIINVLRSIQIKTGIIMCCVIMLLIITSI